MEGTDLHDMYKKTRAEGFGKEAKKRILLGSFVLSSGYYDAYYLKALKTKALIKKAFDEAFVKYDVLLAPASPSPAPHLGESLTDSLKIVLKRYLYGSSKPGRPSCHQYAMDPGQPETSCGTTVYRKLL